MAGGNPTFINVSQREYSEQSWRGRQLAVVQSHSASLRHGRRNQQALNDLTAAPLEIAAALRPHGKTVQHPQCLSADSLEVRHTQRQLQRIALHDGSTQDDSVFENTEQEDLSFEDLNKIFQLDGNVSERECSRTICNAEPTETLPVLMERPYDIHQRLPQRNVPLRSSTATKCTTRPSRPQIWASQAAILQGTDNDHGPRPTDGQGSAHYIFPAISEITSSLDPFIRLPVQVSESDKSLLHFSSFPRKALTIMYLAMLEYVSGRQDLQEMHIQALDDFVESNGGVAIFRTRSESPEILLCSARSYVTQFVRAEVCLPTISRLQSTVSRYLDSLAQVHRWASNFRAQLSSEAVSLPHYRLRLRPLIDYLGHLGQIRTSVESTRVWDAASGAHFCVYSLVITLVEFTHSPEKVFEFLEQVQECMMASVDKGLQNESDLDGLHPFSTGQMIGYVRTLMFRDVGDVKEIRICRAQADAQKVFALLSQGRRDELVSYFVGSVLALDRTSRTIGDRDVAASATSRQKLSAEILKAWALQQRMHQE
ncbi:hypothetical protein PV08_04557 [Exophiala spinifera]|uniref:Uncharacterized protein n=1 Tax=Exophiala spinifera TaxID=91928 RepID=A0A0D2BEE3_9EURO|nr:uncharacterized protein PV08_04557 [Exophiala spinifera]KIW17363.1 hypothetical protein PV08_04557 [Exophiala spinifera]